MATPKFFSFSMERGSLETDVVSSMLLRLNEMENKNVLLPKRLPACFPSFLGKKIGQRDDSIPAFWTEYEAEAGHNSHLWEGQWGYTLLKWTHPVPISSKFWKIPFPPCWGLACIIAGFGWLLSFHCETYLSIPDWIWAITREDIHYWKF